MSNETLVEAANRFIKALNRIAPFHLTDAEPANAEFYYLQGCGSEFIGRCARLGQVDSNGPYYHWRIYYTVEGDGSPQFHLDEFWSPILWTTELYRKIISRRYRPHNEKDDLLAQEEIERAIIEKNNVKRATKENPWSIYGSLE